MERYKYMAERNLMLSRRRLLSLLTLGAGAAAASSDLPGNHGDSRSVAHNHAEDPTSFHARFPWTLDTPASAPQCAECLMLFCYQQEQLVFGSETKTTLWFEEGHHQSCSRAKFNGKRRDVQTCISRLTIAP